jgi:DNA-binding winged helix-turn-helix (wHTH) protein/TolB-like protein
MPGEPVKSFVSDKPFRVGEWLVEPMLDQVTHDVQAQKLEPRTMRLLVKLAENSGKVVSSQELLDSVWSGVIVGPGSLYQAVSQLRKLFGDDETSPAYIRTVPRRGYMLVGPITAHGDLHASAGKSPQPAAANPAQIIAPVQEPETSLPLRASRRLRWVGAASVLVSLIALAAWYLLPWPLPKPPPANSISTVVAAIPNALAVLPLRTPQGTDASLGTTLSHVLTDRLAAIRSLPVIDFGSARRFPPAQAHFDARDVARKLNARYLLLGELKPDGDQLSLKATLLDATEDRELWSKTIDRPLGEVTALREEVAKAVTDALHLEGGAPKPRQLTPLRLDAYALYVEAASLLNENSARQDTEKAAVLFERAITLDPGFVRAYVGLSEALQFTSMLTENPEGPLTPEARHDAALAIDHALRLDPDSGEAWVQRAGLTLDDAKADELFRKGVDLSPNYVKGAIWYGHFLRGQGRVGEAIEMYDRVAALHPWSAEIFTIRASMALGNFGDVQGAIRLLQHALSIDPNETNALANLVDVRYAYLGEFAECIRTLESVPRYTMGMRAGLATDYLDVDDPAAALEVWESPPNPPPFRTSILWRYLGNMDAAVEVAARVLKSNNEGIYPLAALSLRDKAFLTGDYSLALALLEPRFQQQKQNWTKQNADRRLAITYAHLLMLSGRRQEGVDLAHRLLASSEANEVGRPKGWFARERGLLYAMLGDDDRALSELATSQKLNDWGMWWYTAAGDATFAHLHSDPRFRALVAAARKHSAEQRALLDDMRRKGLVPRRGQPQSR